MKRGKSIVIVGATGMVGGHALEIGLAHPEVSSVTVIGRRSTGVEDAKLREVIHSDFADCAPIAEALSGHDVAVFCIGAYTGAVSDAELRKVTVEYAAEFARALHMESPQAAFCFLSGQGADQSEKSRIAFARYKGMAENALLRAGFPRVHLFRPGYIYPTVKRKEPTWSYRLFRFLYPVVRHVYPNIGISSEDLARAMVLVGLDGTLGGEGPVLENRAIRRLVGD